MEKSKKYWYLTMVFWCPICGNEDRYRERKYSTKPRDPEERYEWVVSWDYCDV